MALTEAEELELLSLEREKSGFASTPGGAAVGNPNIERFGRGSVRPDAIMDALTAIGGSTALGGAAGAFSKEILGGAGNVLGALPYPATRTIGNFLKGASQTIGAGGRTIPAISGAMSGAGSETAGQVAEAAGAGPITAEVARVAGGGGIPETANAAKWVMEKYVTKPALSLASHIKKLTARTILDKINDGTPLSATEQKFVDSQISELRGPQGKTDAPLERVGSIMGDEGQRLLNEAELKMVNAVRGAGSVGGVTGYPAVSRELSDIGGDLRSSIVKRNEGLLSARKSEYAKNEKARDAIVSQREGAGQFVNSLPEYQSVVDSLKEQLKPGARSESVQSGIKRVLADIESFSITPTSSKLSGEGDFLVSSPPVRGQMSFQALDDVRRKLGDAFRGKPAEGYEAIGENMTRELYGKVSEIQKRFAGQPQAALLDDYAARTEGLQQFRSRAGKKATALDLYDESKFTTDAATLPSEYFKTRGSVQALKELTGNEKQVAAAALEYANKELSGKDAAAVRKWLGNNSDWVTEVPQVRLLVDRYANRLEAAERAVKNAHDFAAQAAKDSNILVGKSLPAQRAVDLIKSGDTELWGLVIPAISKSPQAKAQMVSAVRQVMADQATSKSTLSMFSRSVRPFLERSGIASSDELNFIAKKLDDIQKMNIPEPERLGMAKRLVLNAAGGWASSAAARAGQSGYQWSSEKVVPE